VSERRTLTIDLDSLDSRTRRLTIELMDLIEEVCGEQETAQPSAPPSRDEELLTLIEKFWKVAGWKVAGWKVAGWSCWRVGRCVMTALKNQQGQYLPEWAESDWAAEEAARVAVRLWGGLTIHRGDILLQKFRVFARIAAPPSVELSPVESDIYDTRGEAALRAVVAASEKWPPEKT
jgi:hypothetical protein